MKGFRGFRSAGKSAEGVYQPHESFEGLGTQSPLAEAEVYNND